jgi:very-short-patch-repair endonuclease
LGEQGREDQARSAAERLLFALLNARQLTRGRFALNVPLPFVFGLRPAEADLAAPDARLVVEIDGYYHFRDPEGYRRDRRKDALLQEHGWFVLRFLADDVAGDPGSVIARIEHALARRDLSNVS